MLTGERIVCLSSLPWEGRPTSRHHLARQLARANDVLFVDPPRNVLRTRSPHRGRLTDVADGIRRLEPPPHLPFGRALTFRTTTPFNQWQYGDAVARTVTRLGWSRPILWTSFPVYSAAKVPSRLDPSVHVLHMTDAIWDFPQYRPAYERILRDLLAEVDIAIATTEPIARRLAGYGVPTAVLTHGVDVEQFEGVAAGIVEPAVELAALPRPLLGFVGRLDRRLDLGLVRDLATSVGTVVLVGPSMLSHADHARLDEAGVRRFPEVDHRVLPAWLAGFDVALLPYHLLDSVVVSRPLKLLEYLAAGLPVVSTDIPAARDLSPHVVVTDDPRRAVLDVLADPSLHDEEARRRRRDRAATESWSRRADEWSELVQRACPE